MMFETLQTLLIFLFTLSVLVSMHEFGHFCVARQCGVKVLRFSVGFGKKIWSKTDRHGTEYVLAAIPLGGYVKMLDEREGQIPESEKHLAFNSKPVLSRIAIVVAGPFANFLLAVIAIWMIYMLGIKTVFPQVGAVLPESPAAMAGVQSGDEIIRINNVDTPSWQQVNINLLSFIGENRAIDIIVKSGELGHTPHGNEVIKKVLITHWLLGDDNLNPVKALGIVPYSPEIPAIIGQIVPGSVAEKAGLQDGDRILKTDGMFIHDWMEWMTLIQENPEKTLLIELERDGTMVHIPITPSSKKETGKTIGYIGAEVQAVPWPDEMMRTIQFNALIALPKAIQATSFLIGITFDSLCKMFAGLVSVKSLSGPITIAKVANVSFQSGLEVFFYFLAMLSISLGVLNLLPIPVLDGGYLLFYLVEMIKGKPISDKTQLIWLKIGMMLVVSMMILALYNDLSQFF